MTVYAITDTKKGRTGIAPTYLQNTRTPPGYGPVKLGVHGHVSIPSHFVLPAPGGIRIQLDFGHQ